MPNASWNLFRLGRAPVPPRRLGDIFYILTYSRPYHNFKIILELDAPLAEYFGRSRTRRHPKGVYSSIRAL